MNKPKVLIAASTYEDMDRVMLDSLDGAVDVLVAKKDDPPPFNTPSSAMFELEARESLWTKKQREARENLWAKKQSEGRRFDGSLKRGPKR